MKIVAILLLDQCAYRHRLSVSRAQFISQALLICIKESFYFLSVAIVVCC